jgi:NAD(P)-dependent dehydrogenase (short-subunit alcohol dehydrogenase family)
MAALATPTRRIGSAAKVAGVVLWLSSPGSSCLTGTVIPIDGGQSADVKPPQMYYQGQPMQSQDGDETR